MPTFRGMFVRKDSTRGVQPVEARKALASLLTPSGDLGVLPGVISGLVVSGLAGTWQYAVSLGHGTTSRSAADGANLPGLDGTTNTPTVAAAPGSGSRWDLIYIWQKDKDAGDATSDAVIDVVQGTAGGSPSKPYGSVPTGALVLGEAQVFAGATGTLHANVTITQVAPRVAARGGVIPVSSQAQKDALNAAATATNPIWIDDQGVLRRSVGAGWVPDVWTPVTLASGYAAYVVASTTFTPPALRVSGDEVLLAGGLVGYGASVPLLAGTTYTINTGSPIAAAFRPMDTHVAAVGAVHFNSTTPTPAEVRVTAAGDVQYIPSAAGTLSGTNTSWIVIPSMRWRKS